ncbi:MAG: thioredoxin domain-containing protein [Terriglobia bacterium]
MKRHLAKALGLAAVLLPLGGLYLAANHPPRRTVSATSPQTPSNEQIIRFIRDRFGVPEKVAMSLDPFHASVNPNFLETYITSDDGQNSATSKKSTDICVSKDGRYLVVSYVPVGAMGTSAFLPFTDPNDVSRRIRDIFRIPESVRVTVGPPKASPFPDFFKASLTVGEGKNQSTPEAYVSRDHRYFVLGTVYDLGVDPVQAALHTLVLENQPSVGPKNAPVTIVEFSDYECPSCARAQEFLAKNLLPTYGDKVRIIFKEFPLPMHEFGLSGAIASQCAYRTNPANFEQYRNLVYSHQPEIEAVKGDASRVREMFLEYAQQAGIDRLQFAGCVDSKATLQRVDDNKKEGDKLSVNSTPTFFINGRMLVWGGPEAFYSAVDQALEQAKKKSPTAHQRAPRPTQAKKE